MRRSGRAFGGIRMDSWDRMGIPERALLERDWTRDLTTVLRWMRFLLMKNGYDLRERLDEIRSGIACTWKDEEDRSRVTCGRLLS